MPWLVPGREDTRVAQTLGGVLDRSILPAVVQKKTAEGTPSATR